MTRFGFLLDSAEVTEVRERGRITLVTVHSRGATKRAAMRGARKEATSIIPAHRQDFINELQLSEGFLGEQWMFTIANDGDVDE